MKKTIKKFLRSVFGIELIQYRKNNKNDFFKSIYKKYKDYTMISEDIYISNLKIAKKAKETKGVVVECGVWRGGMIAGIAEILGQSRQYYLFDSFEGLPLAKPIDGKDANDWQKNKEGKYYYDNCAAEEYFAINLMEELMVKYYINKGWFENTLKNFDDKIKISLLRLDADWYESTIICLEKLYPLVSTGGIIIIDDYYTWEGCSKAVHDYLSREKSSSTIQSGNGFAYIIKK